MLDSNNLEECEAIVLLSKPERGVESYRLNSFDNCCSGEIWKQRE
jgi:hypothetical protein